MTQFLQLEIVTQESKTKSLLENKSKILFCFKQPTRKTSLFQKVFPIARLNPPIKRGSFLLQSVAFNSYIQNLTRDSQRLSLISAVDHALVCI